MRVPLGRNANRSNFAFLHKKNGRVSPAPVWLVPGISRFPIPQINKTPKNLKSFPDFQFQKINKTTENRGL